MVERPIRWIDLIEGMKKDVVQLVNMLDIAYDQLYDLGAWDEDDEDCKKAENFLKSMKSKYLK